MAVPLENRGSTSKTNKKKKKEAQSEKESSGKASAGKAELVRQLIANIQAKLGSEEAKATVGDFIRLLQLEKELEEEQPREITVTWIEPEKEDAEET